MIARLMGRRVSAGGRRDCCCCMLALILSLCLQQGNEEALVSQVRQQFRMNMHETDEAKVSILQLCWS